MADTPNTGITDSIKQYSSEATKYLWLGILLIVAGLFIYVSMIYTVLVTTCWQMNQPPVESLCWNCHSMWSVIVGAVISLILIVTFSIYLSKYTLLFFDRAQYYKRKKLVLKFVNENASTEEKGSIDALAEAIKRVQEVI